MCMAFGSLIDGVGAQDNKICGSTGSLLEM